MPIAIDFDGDESARPRTGRSRAFEGGAWVGLIAGLLLLASVLCLPGRAAYASPGPRTFSLTPKDLTEWAQAIAGSIGFLTAALNGGAIVWHRWGKPRRKRARKPRRRDTPGPGRAPHTDPSPGAI